MFVGESRRLLRDGILGLFDGAAEGRGSCWVVLRAPSGWGKTRVGREVYARLAARQEGPRYWPAEIDPEGSDRKATFPKLISCEPGALPEFFWWGISCSAQGGLPSDSLRRDLAQWEAHVESLESAWKRLVPRRQRIGQHVGAAGRAVAEEGVLEGTAVVAEQVASAVVPAVGLAARWGRWTAKQAVQARRERQRVAGGGEFDAEARLGVVDDVVDVIGRMTRAGLPMVVLVEDAHNADEVLLELLDKALRHDGALLVITTVWPDSAERNEPLAELMDKHRQRLYEVDYRDERPEIKGFPKGAGLGDLERDARAAVLHERFPLVEERTEATLLDRYVNPWALKLFCEIPRYHENAEYRDDQGALVVPRHELDQLPKNIRKLYEELWWALPDEARLALAVAYVVTPTSIHDGVAGGENRWSDLLLREVISAVDLANSDAVLMELDRAPSAHAWVRAVDDYLRAFAEDFHRTTTHNYHEGELEDLANAKEKILTALAGRVLDAHRIQPTSTNTARSILALHAEGYITDAAVAAEAIHDLLEELADSPLDLAERVRLYEHYIDQLDRSRIPPHTDQAIRLLGSQALGEHGQLTKAITTLQDLLDDQTRTLVPDPNTLVTRYNLAYRLGQSGLVDQAIDAFRELLADCERVWGPDDPVTLSIRHNLADCLGKSGRVDQAIVAYRELLADHVRVLGPDHPQTLGTRHNLAFRLGESGRVDQAYDAYWELLADCERVLGPDHPQTFATRDQLADCLGESGRVDQAIDAYRELLADHVRVLGPDHPHTLGTRHSLEVWLGVSGRVNEAIAAFRGLLADRVRVLGPDHPDTLMTRYILASWLGQSGRWDEAIAASRGLLADCERVLGPDHPHTLRTRNSLLADCERVLGPDHPHTLAILNRFAALLDEGGRGDDSTTANPDAP